MRTWGCCSPSVPAQAKAYDASSEFPAGAEIVSQTVREALRDAMAEEMRRDGDHRHAHFHCERCGQIVCLEDVPAAAPALPAGFAVARAELVLHGACADCGRAGVEEKEG